MEDDGTITALRMQVTAEHRRLPGLHVHPRPHAVHGRRRLQVHRRRPAVDLRVHQHDDGGRLPRRRPARGRVLPGAADRHRSPPSWASRPRRSAGRTSSRPARSPTRRRPARTTTSGEYDRALTKALDAGRRRRAARASRRSGWTRNDRTLLGIGRPSTSRCAASGPTRARWCAWSRRARSPRTPARRPHGQGHETTFAQIIADHLGVDFDKIVVRHGDTAAVQMGNGTGGSRSLAVGGTAILNATLKVQEKARRIAASMLEAAFEDVVLEAGRYQVKGAPAKALGLAEIAAHRLRRGAGRRTSSPAWRRPTSSARRSSSTRSAPTWPWSRSTATPGACALRDYVSVDDCGVRIRPMLVRRAGPRRPRPGHRAGAMGGGRLRRRRPALDRLADGLRDPARRGLAVVRTEADGDADAASTRSGAKGIGEAATIGSTPAMVNAVVDALRPLGVRHLDMPLRGALLARPRG